MDVLAWEEKNKYGVIALGDRKMGIDLGDRKRKDYLFLSYISGDTGVHHSQKCLLCTSFGH